MTTQLTKSWVFAAGCVLASLCGASSASAALMIDFKPEPSNDLPEVRFAIGDSGLPALGAGPGSQGNGDGDLPLADQMPGGLLVETPFAVTSSIAGKVQNAGGTTSFRDVTLVLEGLEVSGPAGPTGGLLYQPLGAGTFRLLCSADTTVLLHGHIDSAYIITDTAGQGAVLSAQIQYWGGEIFNAMADALGLGDPRSVPGQFSWSLLNMQPVPLSISDSGYLAEFSADAAGQFDVVPEPSTLLILALGALGLLRRRRP